MKVENVKIDVSPYSVGYAAAMHGFGFDDVKTMLPFKDVDWIVANDRTEFIKGVQAFHRNRALENLQAMIDDLVIEAGNDTPKQWKELTVSRGPLGPSPESMGIVSQAEDPGPPLKLTTIEVLKAARREIQLVHDKDMIVYSPTLIAELDAAIAEEGEKSYWNAYRTLVRNLGSGQVPRTGDKHPVKFNLSPTGDWRLQCSYCGVTTGAKTTSHAIDEIMRHHCPTSGN